MALLRSQIEHCLSQHGHSGCEVHCDYPLAESSRPALMVLSQLALSVAAGVPGNEITIPWVLDRSVDVSADSVALLAVQQQAQAYAQAGVSECWLLDVKNVELRIYRELREAGYQQRLLVHEGETVSPLAFPQLKFTVQEPLPLFFMTRTTTGQKTYSTTMLPLRLSSFQG